MVIEIREYFEDLARSEFEQRVLIPIRDRKRAERVRAEEQGAWADRVEQLYELGRL